MAHTYSVFGSDARQIYLAALLARSGYDTVHTQAAPRMAEVILLPVPTAAPDGCIRGSAVPLAGWLAALPPGTAVWGSGLAPFRQAAAHLRLYEYGDAAGFAELNAVPTAEGAIQLAMQELPGTIQDGRFLVIGYGRIGRALAARLTALGGIVTVARRQPDDTPGCDKTGDYRLPLDAYDAVFNTAPYPVFTAAHCLQTREDCLLIDLASAPGGIAKNTPRRLIHALGLPAKAAPMTAAAAMKTVVLAEMEGIT